MPFAGAIGRLGGDEELLFEDWLRDRLFELFDELDRLLEPLLRDRLFELLDPDRLLDCMDPDRLLEPLLADRLLEPSLPDRIFEPRPLLPVLLDLDLPCESWISCAIASSGNDFLRVAAISSCEETSDSLVKSDMCQTRQSLLLSFFFP